MVLADLYTAISGIGYLIVRTASTYQVDKMFVPIVTLGLLGVTLTACVRLSRCGWRRGPRPATRIESFRCDGSIAAVIDKTERNLKTKTKGRIGNGNEESSGTPRCCWRAAC